MRRRSTYYTQALALAREVGDRAGESLALHDLGIVARIQNQYEQALAYSEQALAIAAEVGDRAGEGRILTDGRSTMSRASTAAIASYEQALAIHARSVWVGGR